MATLPMTPFYRCTRTLARLVGLLWRVRAVGVERVPLDGPLIIAANHLSFFDPPVLGVWCPRQIMYMAKAELFRVPILAPVIRRLGAFPVERKASPMGAIKRSVEVLEAGGVVGVFPEGTRNTEGTARVQQGVALLASLTGAPVLPARLVGTDKVGKFHRVNVFYGTPMRLPVNGKATREDLAKFTTDIMNEIRKLNNGDS